jgi:acyl-CoA reductase-like NAD-dependent aldehyde dehydrogenase
MKKIAIRPQAAAPDANAGVAVTSSPTPPPPLMPADREDHLVHGRFLDEPGSIRVHRPLIGGEESGGTPSAMPLLDPATRKAFARIAYATPRDITAAVDASARAFALWRGVSFQERAAKLRALAGLVQEQAWELADLIAQEQGKPRLEAFQYEVLPALDHLKFIIEHAARQNGGVGLDAHHPFYAHKQSLYLSAPIGVIALVTPSPLPFALPLIQVAGALAMGNAVVLKPSERTPLSALRIGELCRDAGFPAGLLNVVPTPSGATLHLVTNTKVDKVFLTGSSEAGRYVMAAAGSDLRPVVLSLGGKHPCVVAGDADVERAARGVVWGALANAGQNCGAVEKIYVEESIATRFLEALLGQVDQVRLGNPTADEFELGPLQSAERRQRVHSQVTEAVQDGAQLLRGGQIPTGPGFYYPATVLLDPPSHCRLMHEETGGPVIPIVVVDNVERAILLAGDSDYALTASGWTGSQATAERLMAGLPAGVVTINDVLYSYGEPGATWSGNHSSGHGRNHGVQGLEEMCVRRFVSYDHRPAEGPLFAFPYDQEAGKVARASLRYLHGKGRVRRLMAWGRLLFSRRFRRRMPVRQFAFGKGR